MILSLAVAVVLSQSPVKKVEIIRGGNTTKKAAKSTETSITVAPAGPTPEQQAREQKLEAAAIELDAKSAELNQRADELKAKEAADETKRQNDAKAKAAQARIVEKHAGDLQQEYERAANALSGQE